MRRRLTNEEIVDAYFIPAKLTPEEKLQSDKDLRAALAKARAERTPEMGRKLMVLRLRLLMDEYLKDSVYRKECGFGLYLKEYITIQEKKRKVFADEISIDETLLSQLINERRDPPDYIFFRLEIHSNNVIPAQNWYKLVEKRREHEITTSKARRKAEKPFVRRKMQVDD